MQSLQALQPRCQSHPRPGCIRRSDDSCSSGSHLSCCKGGRTPPSSTRRTSCPSLRHRLTRFPSGSQGTGAGRLRCAKCASSLEARASARACCPCRGSPSQQGKSGSRAVHWGRRLHCSSPQDRNKRPCWLRLGDRWKILGMQHTRLGWSAQSAPGMCPAHGARMCEWQIKIMLSDVRVPGQHALGQPMDIPAEHQKPFWHASHWSALLRRSALPAVPAAQGVGAELPSSHHEDSGQLRQAVAPLVSCQLPA